jgi:hypothetical protein
MGAGIAASPHCAERRICRTSDSGPRGTQSRTPAHQLRRRFPSATPSREELDRPTEVRHPKARISFKRSCLTRKSKPTDVPRPFLGSSPTASRFAPLDPKTVGSRVALERSSLPAPRPGWPRKAPKEPSIACRGDRTFGHLPHPSCRCRLPGEAWDRRPDHAQTLTRFSESRQAKNMGASLWITGISGTTIGTFPDSRKWPISNDSGRSNRLPFRSPGLTSTRCPNPRSPRPIRRTCRA